MVYFNKPYAFEMWCKHFHKNKYVSFHLSFSIIANSAEPEDSGLESPAVSPCDWSNVDFLFALD